MVTPIDIKDLINKKCKCNFCGKNTYGMESQQNPYIYICTNCGFKFDASKTVFKPFYELMAEVMKGMTFPIDADELKTEEEKDK